MKTIGLLLSVGALMAQPPNPTQQRALLPQSTGQAAPVFRVTVISRSINAVNYQHRKGDTKIDFRGTELMPEARGTAKVESQMGSTKVETKLEHMSPPSQYGPEFMTFVLWGITPEGRAENLGELVLRGDDAKLLSTTSLQNFGLIVTAEPYFAVTQPSDVVVAENFIRNDTRGTLGEVDAKCELLQRGSYVMDRDRYTPVKVNPKGPLQVAEAENAVAIARLAGAETYASDTFAKAASALRNARVFLDVDNKRAETSAREAAQMAEDARLITHKRIEAEQLEAERAVAAAREAAADAQAEAERLVTERAEEASARAQAERAAALAQQQASQAEADRARSAAMEADRLRLAAESERAQLRERLRQQLNMILETRESARGLIVNISDVLFDFNQHTLKPAAREKMAKVSGILLAYPQLRLELEGHTDSVGSAGYNQNLSEQRANSVRAFLISQGVPANMVTSKGLGESNPVASNDTPAGRQQNRRVELVVSGESIGVDMP